MVELDFRLRWLVVNFWVALLVAGLLSACYPTAKPSNVAQIPSATSVQVSDPPTETDSPTPSDTPTIPPTLTDTPIPPPTSTLSPTPACFKLLNPPEGSRVAEFGVIMFEWESLPGAQKYLLKITTPDDHMLAFDTYSASLKRYLDTIPWEGIYSWQVVGINSEGGVLCISEPLTFSKPRFQPSLTPDRNPPLPRNPEPPNTGGG